MEGGGVSYPTTIQSALNGPPPHPRIRGDREELDRIHPFLTAPIYSGRMLNLIPQPEPQPRPEPYAEAVARLATVRHALRLVDPFGGGPASDPDEDAAISDAWTNADESKRRWFELALGAAGRSDRRGS